MDVPSRVRPQAFHRPPHPTRALFWQPSSAVRGNRGTVPGIRTTRQWMPETAYVRGRYASDALQTRPHSVSACGAADALSTGCGPPMTTMTSPTYMRVTRAAAARADLASSSVAGHDRPTAPASSTAGPDRADQPPAGTPRRSARISATLEAVSRRSWTPRRSSRIARAATAAATAQDAGGLRGASSCRRWSRIPAAVPARAREPAKKRTGRNMLAAPSGTTPGAGGAAKGATHAQAGTTDDLMVPASMLVPCPLEFMDLTSSPESAGGSTKPVYTTGRADGHDASTGKHGMEGTVNDGRPARKRLALSTTMGGATIGGASPGGYRRKRSSSPPRRYA